MPAICTILVNFKNAPDKAAGCQHLVPALQLGEHLLVGFGPFLLGTDEQKPENDEHQNQRHELCKHLRTACGRSAGLLRRPHGKS